jgi:hypothetical protein
MVDIFITDIKTEYEENCYYANNEGSPPYLRPKRRIALGTG